MKKIFPWPLQIGYTDPLDYRRQGDDIIHDPGWWKKIEKQEKPKRKGRKK